ncbi:hypothetical protein BSF38_01343 [Paludisphaera borealis]|uniref:Uncharacterized protein n=1 Tax=Paludisphaera borealis TaxID=1387353 RepID=A0A1U7CLR3_9BACT|nr:hypothetical protein BSF38_01343 [Paludisphaera borealis]
MSRASIAEPGQRGLWWSSRRRRRRACRSVGVPVSPVRTDDVPRPSRRWDSTSPQTTRGHNRSSKGFSKSVAAGGRSETSGRSTIGPSTLRKNLADTDLPNRTSGVGPLVVMPEPLHSTGSRTSREAGGGCRGREGTSAAGPERISAERRVSTSQRGADQQAREWGSRLATATRRTPREAVDACSIGDAYQAEFRVRYVVVVFFKRDAVRQHPAG